MLFFFVIIIVLCRYLYEFVSRKRQQARERANGPIPVPPPNVNQEAAIARANLSWEVEREQYFTIWGFHLFRNRLKKSKPVNPPVRAPPVPRRPGLFAEQWFRFPPGKWPGGAGCDASPIQIWLGFIRYMWSYKTHIDGGPFMCYRLILYQAFIQTYPTMATYYLALAYNQASGQARTRIMGGQGTRKMSFAFLLFAGYFSMYCVNLWLQWSYWLRLGNGRTREAFRTALLLKALRMPEHQRPLPGYFSGIVVPRVDELVDCWHQFFVLCGIPFAFFVQLMLLIASSTRGSGKNSYLILASFFIIGVVFAALARHAKTLLSTEEDKVEAQNRLYSALETQSAKPRHDGASTIADARKDTETFAVANFVFRRRDALRWFVELEAQFEAGVYAQLIFCVTYLLAGFAVINGQLNVNELIIIQNLSVQILKTGQQIGKMGSEWPGYIPALKLIGGILNAKDLGIDKKKTYKKKHHHHHEDPVTAAAHTIQKLFKGKQSPATSQVSAELSPYVASERYRSEESPPQNVVLATVAYPFKAAAGLFMPAPQRRQSDGDLSPMTASSRPVSRAHRANTSTSTMNSPPLAPRMLDDHELPRPPIARNERGLGSTWSDA